MNSKKLSLALLTSSAFSLFSLVSAEAADTANGSLSGKIGVQLTIAAGCTVGNADTSIGTNNWGTLNFGQFADLSSVIDGQALGKDGANMITISCTKGLSPKISVDGGLNPSSDSQPLRQMTATINKDGQASTLTIPYHLYTDSARSASSEIKINTATALSADDSAQNFTMYGRILPSDQKSSSKTQFAAATYSDTVTATLSW